MRAWFLVLWAQRGELEISMWREPCAESEEALVYASVGVLGRARVD